MLLYGISVKNPPKWHVCGHGLNRSIHKGMNDISNVKVHLRTPIGNLNTCIALSLVLSWCGSNMSLFMRKPALCICENKDAD